MKVYIVMGAMDPSPPLVFKTFESARIALDLCWPNVVMKPMSKDEWWGETNGQSVHIYYVEVRD